MNDFPEPRTLAVNGLDMSCHEAGSGFPIVFSHGWPELAYSWRHQLPALAAAGLRAIAPDQRGYGKTSAPAAISAYSIHELCEDLIGLLDALELQQAVFCGHDWGGFLVWMLPQLYPERVAGVISLNTPFTPRAPTDPVEIMRKTWGDDFYIVQFQEHGVADKLCLDNVETLFRLFYRKNPRPAQPEVRKQGRGFNLLDAVRNADPSTLTETVIADHELAVYIETFRRTGFTGGINWYRNMRRNWENTAGISDHVGVPALMICAADDLVLPPSLTDGMQQWVPDVERHILSDCGHWTQQEQPAAVNRLIIDWLAHRFSA